MHIVAVDPGRNKCGVAVLNGGGAVRLQMVVPRNKLFTRLSEIRREYGAFQLVVGDRTGSKELLAQLKSDSTLEWPVHLVDEHLSSREARDRYFDDHPPRGVRRFIPRSMQVPPVPIDDYVAVILAKRYLAGDHPSSQTTGQI